MSKYSALQKAICANDIARMQAIVQKHPALLGLCWKYRFTASERYSACWLALKQGSDDMVFALQQAGMRPTERVEHEDGSIRHGYDHGLKAAAACGRTAVIERWLAEYPTIWPRRGVACNALLPIAAEHGHTDLVQWLLDNDIANLEEIGNYALQKAENNRHNDIMRILGDALADLPEVLVESADAGDAACQPLWHKVDDETIARIRIDEVIGYRLTEVFNFGMRHCLSLQRNLETGAESALRVPFDDIAASDSLAAAAAELKRLGGRPPETPRLARKG